MSKILANQIANYGDNSPIEIKEGLNIPIGKPLQAAGVSGGDGQVLTSTGTTVEWTTPFDGDYDTLTNKPIIPAAQVRSDWNAVGTVAEIQNKPLVPPLPSVTVAAAGSSSLSYNSTSGLFTYTPPDLSGYATTASIANAANWDTAYSWGNHASASYLTAEIDTLDSVTSRSNDTQNTITVGGLTVSNDGSPNGSLNISDTGSYTQLTFYKSSGTSGASIQGVESNLYINAPGFAWINTYSIFYPSGDVILNNGQQGTTTFQNGFTVANGTVSGIDIEDLDNVDISGGLSDQQVLKWSAANSAWEPANDLVGGASGVALSDLSVSTASAGSASLSYNNVNGVFTYTPPDLSGYLTTVAINDVSDVNITNLQDTQILRYNFNSGDWENWSPNYLTSYTETDPVFAASPAASITLTKINQWDTAYGWGNHANGGYLVATNTDKTNWNTAYGWGDHSQAGYLTTATSSDTLDDVTSRGSVTTNNIEAARIHANGLLATGPAAGDGSSGSTYVSVVSGGSSGGTTYRNMELKTTDGGGTITMMTLGPDDVSTTSPFTARSLTASGSSPKLRINNSSNTGYAEFDYRLVGNAVYQLPALPSTNGDVLSCTTAGVMSWTTPGSTGANVTISDTAPGLPTAGDLWWESDKGRLKIYYSDTDSSQWVDASPPLQAPNSPLYVGMVQLWNYGNDITWSGASDGVSDGLTATIRPADGGGGFQNAYVRLTFPTSFVAAEDYAVQVTVSDPSTDGHIYAPSIRKHLDRIDFYVYNLTSSVVATDWYASIAVYPL